jgi:hypothetical protein
MFAEEQLNICGFHLKSKTSLAFIGRSTDEINVYLLLLYGFCEIKRRGLENRILNVKQASI